MRNAQDSPVLELEHNVTWAFENATPYAGVRLAEAVSNGMVANEIGLNCDEITAPPKGPFLERLKNTDVPEIHISLKHLELLWSFIFSWMVIYERGFRELLIDGRWTGEIDSSDPILQRAMQLRDWSVSLRTLCTPWPQELPSPRNYSCDIERWYGEKANLVFQQAAAFLLGHEFAHVMCRHLDSGAANLPALDAIEAEKDADVVAFASIVDAAEDDTDRLSKAWSILSALLSSVYLGEDLRTPFAQRRHPPLHHRLSNFMQMLDFKDERNRGYFQSLASIVLDYAIKDLASIPRSVCQYDDAEEAFSDTLDRIDRWIG
jgi:hypothetical protein